MRVHRLHSIAIAAAAVVSTLLAACGPPMAETMANPAAPHAGVALSFQTDAVIARAQARLRVKPDDWKSVDELAAAYLQKVREIGDPSYYGKAEALLKGALAHDSADPEATASMGLLALARHQFKAGLAWGIKARALDPAASRPLGIIGDPKYPYALATLAKIDAARGRYANAIARYQQAVDRYPLPDFVIGLADTYATSGDAAKAQETYELAAAEQRLYRANGVDLDAELALFDADHRRDLPAALAAARRAMMDRPSIRSADILAWTLYQAGDDRASLAASTQAMRLGTQDAGMFFHRGMIEARLGLRAAAVSDLQQALHINPYFSLLWAPVAQQALDSLV